MNTTSKFVIALSILTAMAVSVPPPANAADKIKVNVKNLASYVIKELRLWDGWYKIVDRNKREFSLGETGSLHFNLDDITANQASGRSLGKFFPEWKILANPNIRDCHRKGFDIKREKGQLLKIIQPNGKEYTKGLDKNVDQVVDIKYEITGTTQKVNCYFQIQRVRKR